MSKIIKDKHFLASALIIVALFAAVLITSGNPEQASSQEEPTIERVSISSDGVQGNGSSFGAHINANGQYIAFNSRATNLIPNDTNNDIDIFVHDRENGVTERVSVASDGTEGDIGSSGSVISADGRYIAFRSLASNLVFGDTNNWHDIFVHDRENGVTERVSVASGGTEANNFSGGQGSITSGGRFVGFSSRASNLVLDDTNVTEDAFVYDRLNNIVERVSVSPDGTEGNRTSGLTITSDDGRYAVFHSRASNFVAGDNDINFDIFIRDRTLGTTEQISIASDGTKGNGLSQLGAMTPDSKFVVFGSTASNLVLEDTNNTWDGFIHNRETGKTERVSVSSSGIEGNARTFATDVSNDGRYVILGSLASNLVAEDTNEFEDVFIHDRETNRTKRVSVAYDGAEANNASGGGKISGDGKYITFASLATNLVPNDINGRNDVFVAINPFFLGPQTPEEQIDETVEDIQDLIDEEILNQGEGNSLTKKLDAALKQLEKENKKAAINQLNAFIKEVEALVKAGELTEEEGQALIGAANNAIELIEEG